MVRISWSPSHAGDRPPSLLRSKQTLLVCCSYCENLLRLFMACSTVRFKPNVIFKWRICCPTQLEMRQTAKNTFPRCLTRFHPIPYRNISSGSATCLDVTLRLLCPAVKDVFMGWLNQPPPRVSGQAISLEDCSGDVWQLSLVTRGGCIISQSSSRINVEAWEPRMRFESLKKHYITPWFRLEVVKTIRKHRSVRLAA